LPEDIAVEVDAFSHWFPGRPMVLLNPRKADRARSRLDAAHELAHLLLHHDADPGSREIERQAQAFGSAFLTPAAEITDELPTRADWAQLVALKKRWGLSIAALLYRARELRVMRDSTYRNAMITLSSRGWRTDEPGDLGPPEEPNLFGQALTRLTQRGVRLNELAERCQLPLGELIDVLQAGSERGVAVQPD
jgi:Zn-dependent peptidase ImmA (M78 family)